MPDVDAFNTFYQPQPEGFEDRAFVACYSDEEPDEFEGVAFGYGSTDLRAIADLMHKFPRYSCAGAHDRQ
jgi:hypothetical protein